MLKAFAAVELGFNIIEPPSNNKRTWIKITKKKLTELNLPDPKQISKEHLVDDFTKWPLITLGVIFSHILKRKEFNLDYIGKYKDQKAYSFFDSGFVGPIFLYEQDAKNKNFYVYCDVRASQSIHEHKNVWIILKHSGSLSNLLSRWPNN